MNFFKTPICRIFVGERYKNIKYFFLIFVPYLIAALLEGASFYLIYLAFSIQHDMTNKIMQIPAILNLQNFSASLSKTQLFCCYLILAITLQVIRALIGFIALYGTSVLSLKTQTEIQKKVYSQIFSFSFGFVSQYKMGDLCECAKSPSNFIPQLFTALNRFSTSFSISLGLLGMLFWISPTLAILTLLLLSTVGIVQKVFLKKVVKFSKRLTSDFHRFSHETVQSLQGLRLIHIFHRQQFVLGKISQILNQVVKNSRLVYLWNNTIPAFNEAINIFLVGIILILATAVFSFEDKISLANLMTYIVLTYRLGTRLQVVGESLGSMSLHYGAMHQINDLLMKKDKEFAQVQGGEFKKFQHQIAFDDVTFKYPSADRCSLKGVSFEIQKGTSTAIVGLSGAGKSTILDLLLSLMEPSKGQILVDSLPLDSFSHESWREKIGVVSQDTFIFNGTLEENIRFGDASSSNHSLLKACELAGVHYLVNLLPQKLNTIVGERGHKLSGGERQRIALARALLRNPEILVLDEATSSLDSHSEHIIQRSLTSLKNDTTFVIVAHRLSTITSCEQILVLDKGQVVQSGKHEELIVLDGLYAHLWALQSNASPQSVDTIAFCK